jgi:hypothetical protein
VHSDATKEQGNATFDGALKKHKPGCFPEGGHFDLDASGATAVALHFVNE